MTKATVERISAMLDNALADAEGEAIGAIDALDDYGELLRCAAGLPGRVDGFKEWAIARAKELRKISKRIDALAEDRGPHR